MTRVTLVLCSRSATIVVVALALSLGEARSQTDACDSRMQTIDVNGATLHYVECGAGEPLVFVHGALGDLHTFRSQLQAFSSRYRAIAYSRRFSPPNAPPQPADVSPLKSHVADLRALLGALKASPAHLVANSGGAYIALALALEEPALVRSLVLGEPPVLPLLSRTAVGEEMRQSFIRRVIQPAREAFGRGDLEDGLRKFMDAVCGPGCFDKLPQSRRMELVERQAPELRSQFTTDPSAYQPALDCQQLGKLHRPTLLVTGERTHSIFLLITAELERCLEGESHVMVPNAGHSMHRENAVFYNDVVAAFLQRQ